MDQLATGLSEGDLSEVVFTDATAADAGDFASVVELMGSTEYVVRAEAGEVVEGADGEPGDVGRDPHLVLGRRRHRRPCAGLDLRDASRPHAWPATPGRSPGSGRWWSRR